MRSAETRPRSEGEWSRLAGRSWRGAPWDEVEVEREMEPKAVIGGMSGSFWEAPRGYHFGSTAVDDDVLLVLFARA